jgi:hypothetical protein
VCANASFNSRFVTYRAREPVPAASRRTRLDMRNRLHNSQVAELITRYCLSTLITAEYHRKAELSINFSRH